MGLSRRRFVAAAGLAALAGCSAQGTTDSSPEAGGSGGSGPPTAASRLTLPMAPDRLREHARSGGPPKDGIPSIDDPSFVGAGEADFLEPGDPVFGVARDGVAKAYPQKILVNHEICNDHIAGTPVSVTYCPLTGTVQGFERGETTFGVSGRLINNNLVMYDRATDTWWPQILATSIPGPWNPDPAVRSLREFRLVWTTWERWREHNPDTGVLSTETGFARNYNYDPYGSYNPTTGYYAEPSLLFPAIHRDDRYHTKRVVIGARTADGAVAFPKDVVLERGVVPGRLGSTPVVAVSDPRYETAYVYLNPDGATVERGDGAVLVDGTGHPPQDLPLDRVTAFDAMWFAWVGYYPDTSVHE